MVLYVEEFYRFLLEVSPEALWRKKRGKHTGGTTDSRVFPHRFCVVSKKVSSSSDSSSWHVSLKI